MEPGETTEDTLRRELHEELGLADVAIGAEIWERTHIIPFINGLWDGQHDRFFLIRTGAFEPADALVGAAQRRVPVRDALVDRRRAARVRTHEAFVPRPTPPA